jgi:hypothetical protein
MNDIADRFYDEVRQIKSMLMRDLGKWEVGTDEPLSGFLEEHADLIYLEGAER